MHWGVHDALYAEIADDDLLQNFPTASWPGLLTAMIFPGSRHYLAPSDKLITPWRRSAGAERHIVHALGAVSIPTPAEHNPVGLLEALRTSSLPTLSTSAHLQRTAKSAVYRLDKLARNAGRKGRQIKMKPPFWRKRKRAARAGINVDDFEPEALATKP